MTHRRRKSEDVKAMGRIRLRKNMTVLYSVVTMYALIVRREKERKRYLFLQSHTWEDINTRRIILLMARRESDRQISTIIRLLSASINTDLY
ncbi:hypothetical protein ACS0PU_010569 [Formica fusca]